MPEMDPIENAYYCTADDVRLIAELQPSELSNDRVVALIEKAQAEIDALLGSTLPVPFNLGSVPAKIRWMCADLAASYVLMKVYIGAGTNQSPYGDILHERVMEQVKRIREGTEWVINSSGADVSGLNNIVSTTPYAQAIFTRGAYRNPITMNAIEDFGAAGVQGSFFNMYNFWWYIISYA